MLRIAGWCLQRTIPAFEYRENINFLDCAITFFCIGWCLSLAREKRCESRRVAFQHPQEKQMPRRPAKVTQADIARAIRAAKEAGANAVAVDGQGNIRIELTARAAPTEPASGPDEEWAPSAALKRHLKPTESG
jgi:hypothetical protein